MNSTFSDFTASELFCPKCRQLQPVRERLLLVLPGGELHDYLCARCGESLAKRTTTAPSVARPVPRRAAAPRSPRRLLR